MAKPSAAPTMQLTGHAASPHKEISLWLKKPNWGDILNFVKALEIIGYTPNRDKTRIEKRGAYFTFNVNICRTVKGDFKHLDSRLILDFVDCCCRGLPRVIEFKPCKALSVEYVRACEEQVQSIGTMINALVNAIHNQASLVDPKEILKKENASKKDCA